MITPRSWLTGLDPYRPGVPAPSEAGSLASNESPLGASPSVARAISNALSRIHRYPDSQARELTCAIAEHHDIDPASVLVGNGSDELIYLLTMAYLAHGGTAVMAEPAYRMDQITAWVMNARAVGVPLRGWRHNLEAMAEVPADIGYVVNPHNPTGTAVTLDEISQFVDASPASLVVVDEAYLDFVDHPGTATAIPLVKQGRVAVLRTFSKIYGLAGLRVGYLVAQPEIIETLRMIRAPFSVSGVAQAAALAALADEDRYRHVRDFSRAMRSQVTEQLARSGLDPVDSQANFVLADCGSLDREQAVVRELAAHGVQVRPGTALGIPATVRVTVPSEEGMHLLRQGLRSFAAGESDAGPATSQGEPINGRGPRHHAQPRSGRG